MGCSPGLWRPRPLAGWGRELMCRGGHLLQCRSARRGPGICSWWKPGIHHGAGCRGCHLSRWMWGHPANPGKCALLCPLYSDMGICECTLSLYVISAILELSLYIVIHLQESRIPSLLCQRTALCRLTALAANASAGAQSIAQTQGGNWGASAFASAVASSPTVEQCLASGSPTSSGTQASAGALASASSSSSGNTGAQAGALAGANTGSGRKLLGA